MSNITYSKQLIQLGLNIARYRKMRGLTQEELSSRIHMSRTHLSNLEAPGKVTSVSLEKTFCDRGSPAGPSFCTSCRIFTALTFF